jgi:hypothetical protein
MHADDFEAKPHRLWVLALLLAVFAVYAPSLANGFTLDGPLLAKSIQKGGEPNPMTASLLPLFDYFRAGYWDACEFGVDRLYRPVTILSYAVTNTLIGGVDANPDWEALPHHLINVLLHVWAVWLALGLIKRVTPMFWAAWLGAAVFGLHALHSEVVAGVVGRAELFGFCFGAQAVVLFVDSLGGRSVWSVLRIASVPLLLFLSFCSKESALAWCPFLFVYALALTPGDGKRSRVPEMLRGLGFAIPPLLAFLVLRDAAIGDRPEPVIHYLANQLWHLDGFTRVTTALMLWGFGLFKCLWPFTLTSDYGPGTFALVESMADPRLITSVAILFGWLAVGLLLVRRHPVLFLSVACFFGFGFVVSNVPFAIGIIFAERLFFTPTLGIAMLVAWVLGLKAVGTRRKWLVVPLCLWLVVSATTILMNNSAWDDDGSRILRDIDTNPLSTRTLDRKARLMRERGDDESAAEAWRESLKIDPKFLKGLSGLGILCAEQKKYEEAEALLLRTLDVPGYYDDEPHVTRFNLFVLYDVMGQPDKAREQLRAAWREITAYERPHEPLIGPTVRLLPEEEVRAILVKAQRVAKDHVMFLGARYLLAVAVQGQGRKDEARRMLEQLRDHPSTPAILRDSVLKALRR